MEFDYGLIEFLKKPENYPHEIEKFQCIQTHISYVFLTGKWVYKIKKPVDFGFLNFTSLSLRKHFCEEEVRLNSRLAQDIYEGVIAFYKRENGYSWEPHGDAVEYAVKMRQLPADRMGDFLLKKNMLEKEHILSLSKKLVSFYKDAETGPEITEYGSIEKIRFNTEENFEQTNPFLGITISKDRHKAIRDYTEEFFEKNSSLFSRRQKEEKVRDGHGDLHLGNICFADEIYIYDCIEFNKRFRYGDVAVDVAFTAMDLDFHDRWDLSKYFIDKFVELSDDNDLLEIIDFYKCYRAFVRGKIHSFALNQEEVPDEEKERQRRLAKDYFRLAVSYTGKMEDLKVIILFGLMGTGKSTLGMELKKQLSWPYLSSDVIRKELAGISPDTRCYEPFGEGIYSSDMTNQTYNKVMEDVRNYLEMGQSVIVDASFSTEDRRRDIVRIAESLGATPIFVKCECKEDEVIRRLKKREVEEGSISDGRVEILKKQKESFDPWHDMKNSRLIVIDTTYKSSSRLVEELIDKAGLIT